MFDDYYIQMYVILYSNIFYVYTKHQTSNSLKLHRGVGISLVSKGPLGEPDEYAHHK